MTDRISLIWIRRLASFGMWACVVATFIPHVCRQLPRHGVPPGRLMDNSSRAVPL